MTAALEGVSGQQYAPAALYSQERSGTHSTGGCVGPRAGLDGRKISSHRYSTPDCRARSQSLYRLSSPAHFIMLGILKYVQLNHLCLTLVTFSSVVCAFPQLYVLFLPCAFSSVVCAFPTLCFFLSCMCFSYLVLFPQL